MANLGRKNGVFLIRFRYRGKEYKRSLKTINRLDAEAAQSNVQLTIHRLLTGMTELPDGIDPGDFIVSGGTLVKVTELPAPVVYPTTAALIERYLAAKKGAVADTYHASQKIHLGHFKKHLDVFADKACNEVTDGHVKRFFEARLKIRHSETVKKERITLLQFYQWVAANKEAPAFASPVTFLPPSMSSGDRPRFQTVDEINQILDRGGLSPEEAVDIWGTLYLCPSEIAGLLATVSKRAEQTVAFLLHAIPAYTGMRRGEVLRLRWIDVDLERGVISAYSRKQSRTKEISRRDIDLHHELRQHLVTWREKRPKGQFVLCEDGTLTPLLVDRANRLFWQPMRGTTWCLDSARNWFKVGFHTYRHSFASNLAAAGVDQRVIDEFMGHQTEEMRRRYRHLFPKTRQSAIESFTLATRPTEYPHDAEASSHG
jgi:integrase